MKYVPNSRVPTVPNGRLKRMMSSSSPFSSSITLSAMCESGGLTSSAISMSDSLVRPIARSCCSVVSASQAVRSCRYFWTTT